MRVPKFLPWILLALISCTLAKASPFGSWAASGIVVKKEFRPTPLTQSLGMDGIYRLELRGEDQKVRHQMVTRDVFLAYEVGDRFNEIDKAGEARKEPTLAAVPAEGPAEGPTPDERVAQLNLPREMLRETEGF